MPVNDELEKRIKEFHEQVPTNSNMTSEEAKNFIFRNHCGGCKTKECESCPYDFAIRALEKEIPRSLIIKGEVRICPTCKNKIWVNNHHCKCGQKILWEENR